MAKFIVFEDRGETTRPRIGEWFRTGETIECATINFEAEMYPILRRLPDAEVSALAAKVERCEKAEAERNDARGLLQLAEAECESLRAKLAEAEQVAIGHRAMIDRLCAVEDDDNPSKSSNSSNTRGILGSSMTPRESFIAETARTLSCAIAKTKNGLDGVTTVTQLDAAECERRARDLADKLSETIPAMRENDQDVCRSRTLSEMAEEYDKMASKFTAIGDATLPPIDWPGSVPVIRERQ